MPVSVCYSNNGAIDPSQPKTDDQAAVSRLYPVTLQNQSSFPGKKVFSQVTARVHGSVFFTDANALPARPMQGVNVVARWIDPATRQPSGAVVASSISGFLFHGSAGNAVTVTQTPVDKTSIDSVLTMPHLKASLISPACRFRMVRLAPNISLRLSPWIHYGRRTLAPTAPLLRSSFQARHSR